MFCSAFEARKRVSRTRIESAAQDHSHRRPSPPSGEIEVTAIVHAAMAVIERRALNILANGEPKRQFHIQPETMRLWIDLPHPERQFQMKDFKASLAADHLPGNRWSNRFDADDAHVEQISPICGRRQKRPDQIDGSVDHGGWAARIAHRAPPAPKDIWRSA